MENKDNKAQSVNILHIVRIFLSYWLLLGVSAFVFLVGGMLYYSVAPRTYSVSSRIVINTARTRGTRGDNTYVNVNEMMNSRKELSNEINFLTSSPLIKEVINDMNLFTTYFDKSDKIPNSIDFGLYNIYRSSPFLVVVDEGTPQPLNTLFTINIIDEDKFRLSAYSEEALLYYFEDEYVSNNEYFFYIDEVFEFGEDIKTNLCSFRILLNSNYNSEDYQGRNLYFRFNSPQNMAYWFQDALRIGGSSYFESSIADLSFKWNNLELAMEFLSRLIDKYIEKNLEKKNFNANNTIDYIEQQLANAQTSLGQSESRLQNFKSTRDVISVSDKITNLQDQIQDLKQRRDGIQLQYHNLTSLKKYFDENKNSSTFIAPSSMGMSDATLATLIQELTTLSREKQDLISSNQLRNPRIKTLDANMASIIKVISDNIEFGLTAANNELTDINNRIAQLNEEYARLPQTQRQLLELEREFSVNDAVYSSLLNQRIQAKIIKASNRSDCEILEPVRYEQMTSPDIKKIGMVSLFLGLLFPSIYIVIVNFLTQKIKTKEDLSKFCTLPPIGTIPHNDKGVNNVISNFPQAPIVERFHSIRSNLVYYLGEGNKTILVTSTLPSEGKSFSSMNLALSFASSNSKTLLLAFDLRKKNKTLEELKIKSLVGLDLYLMNQASLDEVIIKTPYENLDFINNGKIALDPVTLLSSPRIKELFEFLKTEYDYIIIDTPPFGMVTDAFLLMQYADINLYVSRLGVVTKKGLKQSMFDLESKGIKNTYLLTNDISKLDNTYADRYSYGETKKKSFFARIFKRKDKA